MSKKYAIDDENYREIAEILTQIGYPMNHSSARNYVLRVMKKFVEAYSKLMELNLTEKQINIVAKSPQFQVALGDRLHVVEIIRRRNKKK